jgi:hypothetical protein
MPAATEAALIIRDESVVQAAAKVAAITDEECVIMWGRLSRSGSKNWRMRDGMGRPRGLARDRRNVGFAIWGGEEWRLAYGG